MTVSASTTHESPAPALNDPASQSNSATAASTAEKVMSAVDSKEPIIQSLPQATFGTNDFDKVNASEASKIDSGGDIKPGDVGRFAGILGDRGTMMKGSLNDIMFMVMLMLIKSTADNRESSFESFTVKRQVTQEAAGKVYTMRIDAAKEQLKLDTEQAEQMIRQGKMSIFTGVISVATGALSAFTSVGGAFKSVGAVMKVLMRAADIANTALSVGSSLASNAMNIYESVKSLEFTTMQRDVSEMQLEVQTMNDFFQFSMQQLNNMQQAYSSSSEAINSMMDTVKEALERHQQTRLGISRNI